MAIARPWRAPRPDGPYAATPEDHAALNHVFSDAFTERYRRDGLVGVRVPFLNPAIWRYAIEDANGGALIWRDERDEIAAFNIVHCSGREGWMGPLAVRPDSQGAGLGKEVVKSGIDWLVASKALDDRPRDDAAHDGQHRLLLVAGLRAGAPHGHGDDRLPRPRTEAPTLFGRLSAADKDDVLARVLRAVAERGDRVRLHARDRDHRLTGAGRYDSLSRGRQDHGLRAVPHGAARRGARARGDARAQARARAIRRDLASAVTTLADFARRSGTRRVAFRVQTEYLDAYQQLIAMGGRVRWTDLRMALAAYPEGKAREGLLWSNWEI